MKNLILSVLVCTSITAFSQQSCILSYLFYERDFMEEFLPPEFIKEQEIDEMRFYMKGADGRQKVQNVRFDQNGYIWLKEDYYEGEVSNYTHYVLNEKGQPVSSRLTYSGGGEFKDMEMPQTDYSYGDNWMKYKERGMKNEVVDDSKTRWRVITYDSLGRIEKQEGEFNFEINNGISSSSFLWKYQYNRNSNTVSVLYYSDGKLSATETQTFNEEGKILSSGTINKEGNFVYSRNYEYDSKGRLTMLKLQNDWLCESSEYKTMVFDFNYSNGYLNSIDVLLDDLQFEISCGVEVYSNPVKP